MKIFLKQLANINYGKIKVILPDNKIYKFSGSKKGPKVNLKINRSIQKKTETRSSKRTVHLKLIVHLNHYQLLLIHCQ